MKWLITVFLAGALTFAHTQTSIIEADQFYRNKQWQEAYLAYKAITAQNPYHGTYWYRLGYTAMQINDLTTAEQANRQAVELQAFPAGAMYNLACTYALVGKTGKAMDWLKKAYYKGFTDVDWMKKDEDLRALHDLDGFKQFTGQIQTPFTTCLLYTSPSPRDA